LVVVRVTKALELRMAKPCFDCLEVIQRSQVVRVYYTDTNGQLVCELASSMSTSHRCRAHRARLHKMLHGHK